jgi:hypothetical protein
MRVACVSVPILACLAISGCGGSQPSARLSAAQLASQATAICQRAADEERAPGSFGERVARLHEIGTREIDELRRLAPPSSEDATYRAFVAEGERLIELAERLAGARGQALAGPVMAEGRTGVARLRALEQPLGLTACSAGAG